MFKCRRTSCTMLVLAVLCAASLYTFFATADGKKAPLPGSPEFPAYVMDRVDDMYRGNQSHGVMEMQIKTRHWTRTLAMENWSLGKDHTLVRILKPRKERGTATLKSHKDLFMYLNKTGRTIKITSGMMGGSWMGSHFTNDDLVKKNRLSRDYTIKLTFSGDQGGTKVHRFTLKARATAAVVWDRIVVTVRQGDLLPVSQKFYDEDNKLVRTMTSSGHRVMGGRMIPTVMEVRPTDKPQEFTRITMRRVNFEVKLTKGFFTLQKLKSL